MTEASQIPTPQKQPVEDLAARRAYIQKWVARNQRRMGAGLGSAILVLPMLAQAQTAEMINALDISGVNSATVNADGSVNLTLDNGQVLNVNAASVQVGADGSIMISAAAVEAVAEAVAAAGAGAAGTGAGIAGGLNAAGIGAAAAGVGVAAAAAGGGGGSGAVAPAPVVLNASVLSATGLSLDIPALFDGFPELEAGDEVFLRLNPEVRVTIDPKTGYATFDEKLNLDDVQDAQKLSVRVARGDDDEFFKGEVTIVADTVPPEIAIDTPISGDNVLNAAESGEDLVITGTAEGAEDGQIVTVTFNGVDFTTTVTDEAWTLTITAEELASLELEDGVDIEIAANVEDALGNPAETATATLTTDFTAEITIEPVVIETLNTFTGVTVTGGTKGVDENQEVTLTFNGTDYTGGVGADGSWSVTIPAAVIDALEDGAAVEISASVSDEAGNSDTATGSSTTDFSQPALAITSPASGGFINSTDAENEITVSGSALAGQKITVTLSGAEAIAPRVAIPGDDGATVALVEDESEVPGVQLSGDARMGPDYDPGVRTVVADENNSWSVTFQPSDLPDTDGPITINATTEIEGTVINAPEVTLTLDTTPPEITIAAISDDNVLNAAEKGEDLTISGTAEGAEDGQEVTVSFNGQDYTATVEAEAWSLTVPADDLTGLDDGETLAITADVEDVAGNEATQATATLTTDFTAEITIEPVVIETLNTFTGVTIAGGTKGVEEGREVTLSFDGTDYTGTVDADGNWSVVVPAAVIDALDDEAAIAISASVSDEAGNSDTATGSSTTDFSQPALAITSPETGGFINQASAGNDIVVTGSALAGQQVFVSLNGTELSVEADEENSWTVTFQATALPDTDGPVTINATTDIEGTVINAPEVTLTLDTTAPKLTLESDTSEAGLVLSGTTDTDVEEIALTFGGESFTATAEGGVWSLTIPPADLPAAAAGATVTVTANASDLAGNTAPEATLGLTAAGVSIGSPADGFVVGLDAFEGGLTISGSSEDVAEGTLVTITIMDGPDDDEGFTDTAIVDADGNWSLEIPSETVQTAADQTDFIVTASAPGASYPSLASDNIGISTDFPPAITVNPLGEDGALIIGEVTDTLDVSGSTRGVQAGETVTIQDAEDATLGTATVGADGTWSTSVPTPDFKAGDSVTLAAVVANTSGREATARADAIGYQASNFLIQKTAQNGNEFTFAVTVDLADIGGELGAATFNFYADPALGSFVSVPVDTRRIAGANVDQRQAGGHPDFPIADRGEDAIDDGLITMLLFGFLATEDLRGIPLYTFDFEAQNPTTDVVEISMIVNVPEGAAFSKDSMVEEVGFNIADVELALPIGPLTSYIGTDNAEEGDVIISAAHDTVVRGRGGDDQIDVSAVGVHTIIFEGGSVANGFDTITGFTLSGASADRFAIVFDTFGQDVLRGDGTEFQLSSGGAVGEDVGLLVFTTAVADFTAATLEAALEDAGFTGLTDGDGFYLLVGDGTDAQLTFAEQSDGSLSVNTTSEKSYAEFRDIGNLSDFSAANVLGFAPLAEV